MEDFKAGDIVFFTLTNKDADVRLFNNIGIILSVKDINIKITTLNFY